ncbi:hypothetical protein ACJMK2_026983 [Sinanodonta woodiana]|uniref:Uncharacterized protein n=1 Tax=Sinanodonta woodiana TaxID=1069815 RepID=A0ABD3XLA9_SINWO
MYTYAIVKWKIWTLLKAIINYRTGINKIGCKWQLNTAQDTLEKVLFSKLDEELLSVSFHAT